jgi:hypothetical protein
MSDELVSDGSKQFIHKAKYLSKQPDGATGKS